MDDTFTFDNGHMQETFARMAQGMNDSGWPYEDFVGNAGDAGAFLEYMPFYKGPCDGKLVQHYTC